MQSRYYDPQIGRFINADALVSTGQGLLGNNMFAYCLNNPICHVDHGGKDPVLVAAAGGAVAGAVVALYHYLRNAGDSATVEDALMAMLGGMLSGALSGAAGMLTGAAQFAAIFGSGMVAGIFSDATGGNGVVSFLFGLLGAWLGTKIDISMYRDIELFMNSFIASLGVGFPVEMIVQEAQKNVDEFINQFSSGSSTNSNYVGGSMEYRGERSSGGGGGGRGIVVVCHS